MKFRSLLYALALSALAVPAVRYCPVIGGFLFLFAAAFAVDGFYDLNSLP